jgi:hypothetical protein
MFTVLFFPPDYITVFILLGSCIRAHKKVSEVDVEEQIGEVLKHAPHRSGGAKYKVTITTTNYNY